MLNTWPLDLEPMANRMVRVSYERHDIIPKYGWDGPMEFYFNDRIPSIGQTNCSRGRKKAYLKIPNKLIGAAVVDIFRNGHFKKPSKWGPFLVCFDVQQCVGFSQPTVILFLFVGTGTKAQIDSLSNKNWTEIGSLIHRWKEETEIFPTSIFCIMKLM